MHADDRLQLIHDWLSRDLGLAGCSVVPASADASFRRYFRVSQPGIASCIVMDAPPGREDVRPFLQITGLLSGCGVHVPQVLEADIARGLLLLEDLGSAQLLSRLQSGVDPEPLYGDALDALARIQLRGAEAAAQLPPYDDAVLRREMRLMPEWFCTRHLGLELDVAEQAVIESTENLLVAEAIAQPAVFVHRDYHSRNLMVLPERSPGILDYQDALRGPSTYDLVSLLKDCYITWPRARVERWVEAFRERLRRAGGAALAGADLQSYLRGFDLVGLQRHIKVLGIFARLCWRDGKPGYLDDLPRVLDYVADTAARFPELADFSVLVARRFAPALAAANARARAAVPA